jgi:hypothetical protein
MLILSTVGNIQVHHKQHYARELQVGQACFNVRRRSEQIGTQTNQNHHVEIQVLTAASTKMIIFWDVVPCSLTHRPDDGGSKHLWNVGKFLPDYMAQHSKR